MQVFDHNFKKCKQWLYRLCHIKTDLSFPAAKPLTADRTLSLANRDTGSDKNKSLHLANQANVEWYVPHTFELQTARHNGTECDASKTGGFDHVEI